MARTCAYFEPCSSQSRTGHATQEHIRQMIHSFVARQLLLYQHVHYTLSQKCDHPKQLVITLVVFVPLLYFTRVNGIERISGHFCVNSIL